MVSASYSKFKFSLHLFSFFFFIYFKHVFGVYVIIISGRGMYRDEFVTCGGVPLKEVIDSYIRKL